MNSKLLCSGIGAPLRRRQQLQLDIVALRSGIDFVPSTRSAVKRVNWGTLVADINGHQTLLAELLQLSRDHELLFVLIEHSENENVSAKRSAATAAKLALLPALRLVHTCGIEEAAAALGHITRYVSHHSTLFVVILL